MRGIVQGEVARLFLVGEGVTSQLHGQHQVRLYYERLTVRDSSLSDGTAATIAAELGLLDLAYDYLRESACLDLQDLEHATRGPHRRAGGRVASTGEWLRRDATECRSTVLFATVTSA